MLNTNIRVPPTPVPRSRGVGDPLRDCRKKARAVIFSGLCINLYTVQHAMPTYEYRCPECSTDFEKFQKMSEEPVAECPNCGAAAQRRLSGGAGFLFKGSGFYITDYRSESYKKAASSDGGSAGKSDGKTEGNSSGNSGRSESSSSSTSGSSAPSKPKAD